MQFSGKKKEIITIWGIRPAAESFELVTFRLKRDRLTIASLFAGVGPQKIDMQSQ